MKSTGSSHVRVKIVALLAALAALWSFAAYVTVRDGLNLLFVNTLGEVGFDTSELIGAVQIERRLSVVALSEDGATTSEELVTARAHTNELLATWRDRAASRMVDIAASEQLTERIELADTALAQLTDLRAEVDDRSVEPATASGGYTDMIDAGLRMVDAVVSLDDQEFTRQAEALGGLFVAREQLALEDALLSAMLAKGEASGPELTEFTQLVGAQRFQFERTTVALHPDDLALYEQAVSQSPVTELRALEDEVIADARPGAALPVSAAQWRETADEATAALRQLELDATDNALERATPIAVGVIVRLVLAAGLGLIAVLAAVIVSITTARSLVRQLERLRDAARDLANNKLPRVVERLSTGETVDVATEAPPLRFGDDEIGQVGKAFNSVQQTAVRAAVQQAELRHGVRDVFLSLARRTQNLVHKQLNVVDAVERRQTDADEMEDLYRIDHLATRMRRNAENLIVLAGATPGRTWRQPVPMIDVVRGAIGEVEDYQRVNLMPVQAGGLEGRVVGDVIHLLAELIENAASYSPPYAKVSVGGQRVAHGFVVEIEDRGLGMSDTDLSRVNQQLADPPDFSLADASRLGHYVVAKLAQRHGIRVHLRTSPYGGVTAIVLIPQEILVDVEGPARESLAISDSEAAAGPPAAESQGWPPIGDLPGIALPAGEATGPTEPTGPAGTADRTSGTARVTVVRQRGDDPAPPPVPTGSSPVPAASPPVPAATPPSEPNGAPRPAGSPNPAPVRHTEAGPTGAESAATDTASQELPRTPSGLPWRRRQASLPKQLVEEENSASDLPARDPEQVRQAMRSFQLGTQRGRSADDSSGGPGQPEAGQPGDHQEG